MAQPTNTFDSYDAIGNREDLSDLIHKIAQTKTPMLSMLAKKTKATNTFHEWQNDDLAAAADNAQIEGNDVTGQALTATTRVGARTQISNKVPIVTETQNATDSAGRGEEMAYQVAKKLEELKTDMEYGAVRNNVSVTGNSTTARETGGLETWIETNVSFGAGGSAGGYSSGNTTAVTDGTQRAFTETLLKTVHRACADQGAMPDHLMVGTFNKQVVSGFNGGHTTNLDATTKTIVSTVDVYIGDYGTLNIVWNPFQRDRTAFLLTKSELAIASLRPVTSVDLAKTGGTDKKLIETEWAFVPGNEAAHGGVFDLNAS